MLRRTRAERVCGSSYTTSTRGATPDGHAGGVRERPTDGSGIPPPQYASSIDGCTHLTEESASLEKTTALARRQYWLSLYESAVAARDENVAAQALRFVQEYDAFLTLIESEAQSQGG